MDLYTLYAAIRDGVAQDPELSAWATTHFTRELTVFAGLVGRRMPFMDDDAPFVVLSDPADRRGMDEVTIGYEVSGWIGLSCGDMREDSLENVIEPAGIEQITEALRLVRSAIQAVLPDSITLTAFETASDTMGANDEVHGHFVAQFIQRLTIGQSPLR